MTHPDGRPDTAMRLLAEALPFVIDAKRKRVVYSEPWNNLVALIARINACLNPPSSSPTAPMPDSRSYEGDPRSPRFIPED